MDVTATLGRAWDRTRNVLFPFDFGKWISFGVIFFLQSLLEGSGLNFPSNNFSSRGSSGRAGPSFRDMIAAAKTWMDAHMGMLALVGAVTIVLVLALGALVLWLGARGQMMAIRAVATGRAAIGEHWAATREAAFSLFKAHLVISGGAFVLGAPLVVLAMVRLADLVMDGAPDDAIFAGMIPFAVVLGALFFVTAIVTMILRNFIAPVMVRCHMNVGDAWSHFRGAASGHWGAIVLFFVIRFFLGLGAMIVAFVAVLCTCCIGALPVIHQAIMAPWYFFERAYGLEAIESLGPGMEMFEA
jgi:hypothetical protein